MESDSAEAANRATTSRFLDVPPAEAIGPARRIAPIRKPDGFTPAVQRWSFLLPPGESGVRVAFFGAQADTEDGLDAHPLLGWAHRHLLVHPAGPTCVDHARARLPGADRFEHVVSAYWVREALYARWAADAAAEGWWHEPERREGRSGSWREILAIPRDRQESIYWKDHPGGLMRSPEVDLYPTPYCGYYGAMRDRLPAAAFDSLDTNVQGDVAQCRGRRGYGEHWAITPPVNLALIRSANTWGRMDAGQLADYEAKLRIPLAAGMGFLTDNPLPTGCVSMRWQGSTDAGGGRMPEEHAHAYFLSLRHMERWAEGHETHAAIFRAAIQRYRSYGIANQLRTWHEVYVLPERGQVFEYVNCAPETGLLNWFEGVRVA
ncbi:phenylacetaldoxime dehydratase family protein [Methylobacterium sp. J-070]|uniref:phenylacetaldoxime dehydratase family protein n=1 Tax=Methylobacterium sp. J-070 TaxID=2836650 RepID=UPI001FBAA988|nr:phenylacetaldoxime dehydratase family protein [Methylobacterium sp. J-070]MCJ2048930.1 phenylacetaldoxime dehydratase family protein [Methylobacterium sp. J-070]